MLIEREIYVDAPPQRAWAVLSDFPAYAQWNPFTPAVQGQGGAAIELGARVVLDVRLAGLKMRRVHRISRLEAPSALCWALLDQAPWLLRGERCQRLIPKGEGCVYHNSERVEGLVSPLVKLLFGGAIAAGLDAVGAAFKARVEG